MIDTLGSLKWAIFGLDSADKEKWTGKWGNPDSCKIKHWEVYSRSMDIVLRISVTTRVVLWYLIDIVIYEDCK